MNRGTAAALILLLAGCSKPSPSQQASEQAKQVAQEAGLECAIGPEAAWSSDCGLERDGDSLTIRHPDGGFRRFRILSDGRGVEAADGSEKAQLQIVDQGRVEIRIGGDRYRMPVRIAGAGQ